MFFSGDVVHGWSQTETKNNARLDTDKWIYSLNENTKSMTEIDDCLRDADNAVDKLKIIQELLVADNSKDRFYIDSNSEITKRLGFRDKIKLFTVRKK